MAADEIGQTGLLHFKGTLDEEWHPRLRGRQARKVYREMLDNSAIIGGWAAAQEFLVRQVRFRIDAANPSDAAKEAAEFVESALFEDLETSFDHLVSEILTSPAFGFSLFEKTFKIRSGENDDPALDSKFDDRKIGWFDLAVRSQDTVDEWLIDEKGRVQGFWQSAAPAFHKVFIPIEKLMHFRPRSWKNSPEGRSMLRHVYRQWYFLKRVEEYEAIGIEKNMAGIPKFEIPLQCFSSNATSAQRQVKTDAERQVSKIQRGRLQGLVVPHEDDKDGKPSGYRLSVMGSGGQRIIDTDVIIKRMESRIMVGLLSELLLLGMDQHGSFALSDSKTNLLSMYLGSLLKMIVSEFNRDAIPELCSINGIAQEDCPSLKHSDIERPELTSMANYLQLMLNSGALPRSQALTDFVVEYGDMPAEIAQGDGSTSQDGGGEPTPQREPEDAAPLDPQSSGGPAV